MKGVCRSDAGDSHIVKLPAGMDVKDCFSLTGDKGYVYTAELDEGSLFLYVPYELTTREAMYACSTLVLHKNNYMTFEEAKEYIEFLK